MADRRPEFRTRIITIGHDVNIGPNQEMHTVELNGKNAGYNGFRELYGDECVKVREAILFNLAKWISAGAVKHELELFLCQRQNELAIANKSSEYGKKMERNSFWLELLLSHKAPQKYLLPKDKTSPFIHWQRDNFDELEVFIDSAFKNDYFLNNPILVFKEYTGAHGDGVRFFYLRGKLVSNKLKTYLMDRKGHLELFLPSMQYLHPETGAEHNGCVRVLVDYYIECFRRELIFIYPIWSVAYTRLAPKPWDPNIFDEDIIKANLTGNIPAIPMALSSELSQQCIDFCSEVTKQFLLNVLEREEGMPIYFI